jgi:PPE-repeat protein
MTDETDEHAGLARAALALTTAIASEVRNGAISLRQARTVFKTARWLVQDCDRFAENARTAEAADNFLTVSEAVVRHKFEPGRAR